VAETFSGGVFFIFSSETLFFWKFFFVFSESEHAQGHMPLCDLGARCNPYPVARSRGPLAEGPTVTVLKRR
jgi:hypothetical protein